MKEVFMHKEVSELLSRGLFDSVEFLFKSGLVSEEDSLCRNNGSLKHIRAINLFQMQEYYQVFKILSCEKDASEYVYCKCCSKEAVFLRNYSSYLLSTIKQESVPDVLIEKRKIKNIEIDKEVSMSQRIGKGKQSHIDNDIFNDPYLLFLFLLTKKEHLTGKNVQRILLYLVRELPYFWEIYKMLFEICTLSNIEDVLEAIPSPSISALFLLCVGAKKHILHPLLRNLIDGKHPEIFSTDFSQSMLASVYGHYKRYKEAMEIFDRLIMQASTRENIDQYTNILYSLKDADRLSSLLFIVYDRYYNLPIYSYVAGNLLSLKGNHIESIEQFQKILHDAHPGEFDIAYVFVAQEYFHLKDTCSSIKACNIAIKKNYNDYRVWHSMSQIYFAIEMFEYALHFFRMCVERDPENPEIYDGLGQCFEKLEKDNEAIKCYKKGMAYGSTKSLSLLGSLYHKQNNMEFQNCYKEYITTCFNLPKEKLERDPMYLENIEMYMCALEDTTDPDVFRGWKKSYRILLQNSAQ
ncbi:anaphase-promoting complex subunit 8 [Nematocida sp. LUAm3]|nr:anaphase-promoting complex subunit 8 [Nematocida sp. LUAm3]KAI5174619.1 anaphase-promoting complex subunit 8 [Nematocida sp. LUAm2]KAI5177975.1 anaphase-promoting complex subunit 8 [Nematocida sp. LUAm1]